MRRNDGRAQVGGAPSASGRKYQFRVNITYLPIQPSQRIWSEEGVRLAKKMQVGLCIHVGIQLWKAEVVGVPVKVPAGTVLPQQAWPRAAGLFRRVPLSIFLGRIMDDIYWVASECLYRPWLSRPSRLALSAISPLEVSSHVP
jgi:hypothetical protein